MEKIGLYFGSFNPIHIGHITIAQEVLKQTDVNKVMFVISPQNPFKEISGLAPFKHRYNMVKSAMSGIINLGLTDIENKLPYPSYTCRTLHQLEHDFKNVYEFALIMGADNLVNLNKWKNPKYIVQHEIIVYPRTGTYILQDPIAIPKRLKMLNCKPIDISSTQVRNYITHGLDITSFVHPDVLMYIKLLNLYRSNNG